MEVTAITSFDHDHMRVRRGDPLTVSPEVGRQLISIGLVRQVGEPANPSPAAGALSSASPATRVSQKRTPKRSNSGETPTGSNGR